MNYDQRVLELALKQLTKEFDKFIGECLYGEETKAPSKQAVMKARACLPSDCEYGFKRKK
jgi:hypothetical protein